MLEAILKQLAGLKIVTLQDDDQDKIIISVNGTGLYSFYFNGVYSYGCKTATTAKRKINSLIMGGFKLVDYKGLIKQFKINHIYFYQTIVY